MRILRSQYMKLQAQQGLNATSATTTTTYTQLHKETAVQHRQSTHTYLTRAAVKKDSSIQTVTTRTHTTLRRNSILPVDNNNNNNNNKSLLYRRNSTFIYNERPAATNDIIIPQHAIAASSDAPGMTDINVIAKPTYVQKRRQTVTCCTPDELIKQQVVNALKIKLINAPRNQYSRINVVVRFYDEGSLWYTRFYRSYQNVLWKKLPRENPTKNSKWYFKCEVCQKSLGSFNTLKSHLNIHMEFFPYRCGLCPKKYAGCNSFSRHKKQKHTD